MKNKIQLERNTEYSLIPTLDVDAIVYATEDVPIDRASIEELAILPEIVQMAKTIDGKVNRFVFTPDFHKGSGIPVGTVIQSENVFFPKAIGNDIGCGMALASVNLSKDKFEFYKDKIKPILKHVFYEGGRDLPLSVKDRESILTQGILSLRNIDKNGLFETMNKNREWFNISNNAHYLVDDLWSFSDYVKGSSEISRDAQLGTLSGGNHFLEFGYVSNRINKRSMYESKMEQDQLTILAHNGSVGFGTAVGTHFGMIAEKQSKIKTSSGFYPLHIDSIEGQKYLNAMAMAANFAAVNRIILIYMALYAISKAIDDDTLVVHPVIESPHNMLWKNENIFIHRKGSAPAYEGSLFVVPGSSGTKTLLFSGNSYEGSLKIAPHGAGRAVRRMNAREGDMIRNGEVLPPVDPKTVRNDIAKNIQSALNEEAPKNYKPIEFIGDTVVKSGMGNLVGELTPILTLKRP